jgi:copper chaperone CopZ
VKALSVFAIVAVLLFPTIPRAAAGQKVAAGQKADQPVTKVCTLKVSGMTCAGCEAAVRMAARSIDGVKNVKASYAKHNAEVTYDPAKTTPEALAKVITEKSGFKAELDRGGAQK